MVPEICDCEDRPRAAERCGDGSLVGEICFYDFSAEVFEFDGDGFGGVAGDGADAVEV